MFHLIVGAILTIGGAIILLGALIVFTCLRVIDEER